MSVRIICDGCGKRRVLQPDFYILNIQYPFDKNAGPVSKHLCTSCKKIIMKCLDGIEPFKEIESEINLINPDSYRSQLILRAGSLDIRKMIALRKAGWTIENICKEIDVDRSDIIVDICQYYDKTKDEFKDCKKGNRSDSYDFCDEEDEKPVKPSETKVEEKSESDKKLDQLIDNFYESRGMRTSIHVVRDVLKSTLRKDAKVQAVAERLSVSISSVITWRDDFKQYLANLGVEL